MTSIVEKFYRVRRVTEAWLAETVQRILIKNPKKILLRVLIPYAALIASAFLFFWLARLATTDSHPTLSAWLVGISANMASVIVIYLSYQAIKAWSERNLKKGLFRYAKVQIDGDIFSILQMLSKIIYGTERGRILGQTMWLTRLNPKEIGGYLVNRKLMGFQLFKSSSSDAQRYFAKVLENSFILNRLNEDQILVVINIVNALANLNHFLSKMDNFTDTGERAEGYKVENGIEWNSENAKLPNRYLLLRHVKNDEYSVEDFGDFAPYDVDKLTKLYIIKPELVPLMSIRIYEVLSLIREWIGSTGDSLNIG